MYTVNLVDAICGVGKTSAAINMINEASNDEKFLYITPFLTEVQRIKEECKIKKFKEPQSYGNKIEGIKHLFKKRENIVSTHALFRMFDQNTLNMTHLNEYTLIMDEVAEVVELMNITNRDLKTILERYATVQENGVLVWHDVNYKGRFDDYKVLCDLGCVSIYGSGDAITALVWCFPIEVFKAFKNIYILTYMFDGQLQKYYFDNYGVEYNNIYVKDFRFTEEVQEYNMSDYKELFNICQNEKMNLIGDVVVILPNKKSNKDGRYALGVTWYKESDDDILRILKNNCVNYFKNIVKTKSKENMWTTFKQFEPALRGKGYAKGFVSINSRATNEYRHKESVAYLGNRFFNPLIKNFFIQKGVEVNEDTYALSELLQFLFRSRLRNKQPINLYIPSKRMRTLLENWIDSL